jgi:hypothetical protein
MHWHLDLPEWAGEPPRAVSVYAAPDLWVER